MASVVPWVSFVSAEPLATPTPFATPTLGPVSQDKCCACVIPDKSEKDHEMFAEECHACFLNEKENPKAQGCTQKIVAENSKVDQMLSNLKRQGQCTQSVYLTHNQHGPSFGNLTDLIRVCVKAFPTCSLDIDDRSCLSFRDEERVANFIANIRSEMYPEVTLTMCGNTSTDVHLTCARLAASKVYVVSTGDVATSQMSCNPEGSTCKPAGDEWSCLDPSGKLVKQTCCQEANRSRNREGWGVWVTGESCKDVRRCEECPSMQWGCRTPTLWVSSRCETLEAGGQICEHFKLRCSSGTQCLTDRGCVAMATPTVAVVTPVSRGSSSQQTVLTSESISPVPGVTHHFKGSSSTLAAAFTEDLFFGSSEVAPISGARGVTGVALLSLDPVSSVGIVGLRKGDIIHFVNDQKVASQADIISALGQSRKRTFITYSRVAPKEKRAKPSVLSVNNRWNWIVTIHQDDSLGNRAELK